jgi:AcrR family transcriptional regulator
MNRLLDAAEAVIREEGIGELTVTKVVQRAGTSVGAFYRRFPNRDALVYALQKRSHFRAEEAYKAQLDSLDTENSSLEDLLEELLFLRAELALRDASLVHAFVVEGAVQPTFQDEGRRFFANCRATLNQVLLTHREILGHPDPEVALEVVCRSWLALVEQIAIYGKSPFDAPARTANSDLLVAEFCRAMASYLRSSGPTRRRRITV